MNREEIIQAISDDKMMPFIQPEQLAQIVEFVINNYRPSLPSDLDEAAEEYANKEYPNEPAVGQWGTGDYEPPIDMEYPREVAKDAFKAGAEWMKAKMLEVAVEGTVVELEETYKELSLSVSTKELNQVLQPLGLEDGDKVKIIIVKEDK